MPKSTIINFKFCINMQIHTNENLNSISMYKFCTNVRNYNFDFISITKISNNVIVQLHSVLFKKIQQSILSISFMFKIMTIIKLSHKMTTNLNYRTVDPSHKKYIYNTMFTLEPQESLKKIVPKDCNTQWYREFFLYYYIS